MGMKTRTQQGKSKVMLFLKKAFLPSFTIYLLPFTFVHTYARAAEAPVPSVSSPRVASAATPTSARVVSESTALEEGRALFDNGQYMPALSKFFTVLRRDPTNAEARRYVTLVVDEIRKKPRQMSEPGETLPAPVLDEEVRARVRQRQLLSLDLNAIPGIHVEMDSKQAQVIIPTPLLFADNSGGLKEQSIPILDRVFAWLKTYGQQPVTIHCYPEELQNSTLNGSLFLHRYAQLYGYFVDERRLPATRFVNSELLTAAGNSPAQNTEVDVSSNPPRVVITTLGGGTPLDEINPTQVSRWLEFSILSSRMYFDPAEGDWVSLDLAALARKGVRAWYFNILPANAKKSAVFSAEGKGNLLTRLSWDGHDQKSGSFAAPGDYVCRLTATDAEGVSLTKEAPVKIQTSAENLPVLAENSQPREAPPKRHVSKHKPKKVSSPPSVPIGGPEVVKKSNMDSPPATAGNDRNVPSSPADSGRGSMDATNQASASRVADSPPTTDATAVNPPSQNNSLPSTEELLANTPPKDNSMGSPHQERKTKMRDQPAPQSSHPSSPAVGSGGSMDSPLTTGGNDDQKEDSDSSVHAIWKQVIQFDVNDSDLKPTLKSSLERIGKTLEVYPLQKVRILGFADASETDAKNLARKRAEMVRDTLVNEYQVDAHRVLIAGGRVASNASGQAMSKVEMSITN